MNSTDELETAKAFPMVNQSNKKVLSDMQQSLYFGHGNSINNMKKLDYPFTSLSSDDPAASVCASTFLMSDNFSLLMENLPNPMSNTKDLTLAKRKSEVEPNCEIANGQVTPSRNLSASDYQITPETFTKQCGEDCKDIVKKLRRRSTIGARGSPENDSLIRYIAHQRRMRIQGSTLQASPFHHQKSLLKDKIAAFQSSFKAPEEAEEKAIIIQNTSNTRFHEQSTLSQAWPPESKEDAFEENLNHKFMNGDTSADIQMHGTRFPSQQTPLSGTSVISKAILVSPASSVESGSMSLIATPSMDISGTECGTLPSCKDKELSRNATSQHSCKKVRFSEEQSLKMFDENKPPITPRQKGHLFSSYLRSVLKKTPVETLSESLKDLQRTSEVATPVCAVNSHLKETQNNSSALQATSTRTRAKRKCVAKSEEMNLTTKIQAKHQSRKLQEKKPLTKPKVPAARRKITRKRGKRKKEQKALYGQRETASKKPLLSPILETSEDVSFLSSCQSTPTLKVSILDDSSTSILYTKFMNETAKDENSLPHIKEQNSYCQHSSLDLLEEDCTSFQLQDTAVNSVNNLLPQYVLGTNSPGKLKSSLNGNKQAVRSDYCSGETEVQLKEFLNLSGSSKKVKTEEALFFTVDVEPELTNKRSRTNFRRNSRRLTKYFPNAEKSQSKSPGDGAGVPGANLEDVPPCSWSADDIELLNNLQKEVGVAKKVRRSMRRVKGAENEGLAWVQIPANDFLGQVPLESTCKVQRRLSSAGPQESEHAVISSYESKRRKSVCVMDVEKDKSIIFHTERNRRASLGYKSDRCHQKAFEIRKFLKNQPAV